MKLISVSILFICLMAATFSNWVIIAAYDINQKFISNELCENKDKPAMQCNGHCFLNKQLTKEEQPTSPLNTKAGERFEIQLFCVPLPIQNLYKNQTDLSYFTQQQIFSSQQYISCNFRPPQA